MTRPRFLQDSRPFALALLATLLCGLMQNGARTFARLVAARPLDHGVHAWWMTPLGDAVLFFPLAALLVVLGSRFRWAGRPAIRVALLTFPIIVTALFLVGRLHYVPQLLLAAGIAVRLGAWAARIPFERHVSRMNAWLLAITLVVAVPFAVWPALRERLDERALATPPDGAPNVLILLWDTVRASSLDLFGYPVETAPFLTRLAGEGVAFERAFATASYTLPSHSSLFTGHWAHELSSTWRVPLNAEPPTLAEVLAAAGYRTGAFSANRIYVTREFGLGRGFSRFDEHRLGLEQVIRSSTLLRAIATSTAIRNLLSFDDDLARVRARDNQAALLRWLNRDRERPYFAFVNFMEAHTPYLPAPAHAKRFGWYREGASRAERRKVGVAARKEPEHLTAAEAVDARRAYDASISELDAGVHAMLSDLEARGLLENTLLIITADHGEEFGEHGHFGHGNTLYAPSLHVPLVMRFPGRVPQGVRVRSAVSIRDLAATVLDLVGMDARLPGSSLRAVWDSADGPRSRAALAELRYDPRLPASSLASSGDLASVIDDSLHVIRKPDGRFEAFDVSADVTGTTRADTVGARFAGLRDFLPRPRALSSAQKE